MEYKKCPFCNELNDAGNKFCTRCGGKFPVVDDSSAHEDSAEKPNTIKCPFCKELNDIDNKFCTGCGGKFPVVDDSSAHEDGAEKQKTIECPECRTVNNMGNIECKKCGHLLKEDIKKTFHASQRDYRKCPVCGAMFLQNNQTCTICGYDFSDLKIGHDSASDFFNNHPECAQYTKNLEFFKEINEFHDYDVFLFEFRQFCNEKNIDLSFFDIGMVECPECSDFFSFLSPHFIKNHSCPHCAVKFNLDSNEAHCLNCGRPVRQNQTKCECGYELADIKCPHCTTFNAYTDKYCISCGKELWSFDVVFASNPPRGCVYDDGRIVLDWDFLKEEIVKNPHQTNGEINTEVLREQYLRWDRISNELISRWWNVFPFWCKSCTGKMEPFRKNCPKCNISHYSDDYYSRVRELKSVRDSYVECERAIDWSSNPKWTYKLSDSDVNDYLNFLAPEIGESKLNYMRRLLKEWGEISAVKYLIKSEWDIYFDEICMNCGGEIEKYVVDCPSCGMKKNVMPLAALFGGEQVKQAFPFQYKDFIDNVKNICSENGGDISYIDEGVAGCPQCSSYFNILTNDFVDTRRCPHCGVKFNIDAEIYSDDPLGDRRCPNCGDEMHLSHNWFDYGDLKGEEVYYKCPNCGHSKFLYEDLW